jgi:hypothetical protein
MASFSLATHRPLRLVLDGTGPHRFGGAPLHAGVIPKNCDTPLHLVLALDLRDPLCPFKCDQPVNILPLYYPFKYGIGGAEVQYSVLSDSVIELLYMNNESPDPPDQQYVQIAELPSSKATIVPLEYEEARILAFGGGGYFQPSKEDMAIYDRLDINNLIHIGGRRRINQGDQAVVCRNPSCPSFNCCVWYDRIASIPGGVPVRGEVDFWSDFGGDVDILFFLCRRCGTVISFNEAS